MNATAAGSRVRVIVAVGSTSPDPLTLAAAAQLAQAVGGELAALFVEDINLLRLAELPFAFEIGATLPTPRPLATRDVERAFRAQAADSRRALAEIANALQLDFTFEIVRGKPASALFEASAEQDLIVLAGTATRVFAHNTPASTARHALRTSASPVKSRRAQPVAAMLEAGPSAQRVLAVALELARAGGADLILLLAADESRNAPLAAVVENWLEDRRASARIIALPDSTPDRVARLVAQAGAHALLWPGDGDLEIMAKVEPLLAAISCPLIVVR
jgi:hypothetical protein